MSKRSPGHPQRPHGFWPTPRAAIAPIGRVSWMGNGTPGKDNCAWYQFDARNRRNTVVHARTA